jgi:hypothetical protein
MWTKRAGIYKIHNMNFTYIVLKTFTLQPTLFIFKEIEATMHAWYRLHNIVCANLYVAVVMVFSTPFNRF